MSWTRRLCTIAMYHHIVIRVSPQRNTVLMNVNLSCNERYRSGIMRISESISVVRSRRRDKPCRSLLWQQNSTAAIWRSFARHSQWTHFGKRTEGGGINEPCRKRSTGFFQFCVWLLLHQKQQAPSCIEMREEAYNWGGSWCTQQTEDFWEHLMRILLSRILLSPRCQNRCLHLREEM